MVGLLNFISLLFLHDLMASIIKHTLLSNPLYSIIVLVSLLLLGDSLSVFILACTVFKVGLLLYFTIRTHLGRTYKSLADVGTLLSRSMKITVCIWKLHHLLKRIAERSHKSSWEKVIPTKRTKLFHNLMHFLKRVTSSKTVNFIITKLSEGLLLIFTFASASTHYLFYI